MKIEAESKFEFEDTVYYRQDVTASVVVVQAKVRGIKVSVPYPHTPGPKQIQVWYRLSNGAELIESAVSGTAEGAFNL